MSTAAKVFVIWDLQWINAGTYTSHWGENSQRKLIFPLSDYYDLIFICLTTLIVFHLSSLIGGKVLWRDWRLRDDHIDQDGHVQKVMPGCHCLPDWLVERSPWEEPAELTLCVCAVPLSTSWCLRTKIWLINTVASATYCFAIRISF